MQGQCARPFPASFCWSRRSARTHTASSRCWAKARLLFCQRPGNGIEQECFHRAGSSVMKTSSARIWSPDDKSYVNLRPSETRTRNRTAWCFPRLCPGFRSLFQCRSHRQTDFSSKPAGYMKWQGHPGSQYCKAEARRLSRLPSEL